MADSERRRLRMLIRSVAAIIVLAAAAAIAAKYWIVPAMVRERLREAAGRYWDGTVEIDQVEFNYFGPIRLRGVRLLDGLGRQHAAARSVTLLLEDITRRPVLRDVVVEGLAVRAWRADGKFVFPVRIPARTDRKALVDMHSLQVDGLRAALYDDGVLRRRFGPWRLELRQAGKSYVVELSGRVGRAAPTVSLDGAMRPGAGGEVVFTGRLSAGEQTLAREFKTVIRPERSGRNALAVELAALALGGKINGSFTFDREPDRTISYSGRLRAQRLRPGRLGALTAGAQPGEWGVLTADVAFNGRGGALAELRGSGQVLLEDVSAARSPGIDQLLTFLNGADRNRTAAYDIEAAFGLRGDTVTLHQAHLASSGYVMKVEKGGTIHLASRKVDLYLITLHLRDLGGFLGRVPLVNLTMILADKLARVHVTGTWDNYRFKKEPMADVSSATMEWLEEMVRSGGRIGSPISGALERLVRTLTGEGAEPPRPRTAPSE